MTEGHDERDCRIALGLIHDRADPGVPVGPRPARAVGVRIRDRDEARVAVVEPVPVLAIGSWGARDVDRVGCGRAGLGVGKVEAALVVPQIIRGLVPLVVAPHRHVGRVARPGHDVVEVIVDMDLARVVGIRDVPDDQHELGAPGGDHGLERDHPGEERAVADVALGEHREARGPPRWRGAEGVIGTAADRIVIERVLHEPGESCLPERPGRREGHWARGHGHRGLPVAGREPIADRVFRPAPVEGHGGLTHEGPVDLVGREGLAGGPQGAEQEQATGLLRCHDDLCGSGAKGLRQLSVGRDETTALSGRDTGRIGGVRWRREGGSSHHELTEPLRRAGGLSQATKIGSIRAASVGATSPAAGVSAAPAGRRPVPEGWCPPHWAAGPGRS